MTVRSRRLPCFAAAEAPRTGNVMMCGCREVRNQYVTRESSDARMKGAGVAVVIRDF